MKKIIFILFIFSVFVISCEKTQEQIQEDLIKAVKAQDIEKVSELLSQETDPFLADETGNSAFHYAADTGNSELVALIAGDTNENTEIVSFHSTEYLWSEREACRYHPFRAIDGDPHTSWIENDEGAGIGEELQIELNDFVIIDRIIIMPGFFNSKYYSNNNRVKQLTFKLDFDRHTYNLPDIMHPQELVLPYAVRCRDITLIIDDIYMGEVGNNTCVAEIEFYFQDKKIDLDMNTEGYIEEENELRAVIESIPEYFVYYYNPNEALKVDIRKREIIRYSYDYSLLESKLLFYYYDYTFNTETFKIVNVDKTESGILINTQKENFYFDTANSTLNDDYNSFDTLQKIEFNPNVFVKTSFDFPADPEVKDVAADMYCWFCGEYKGYINFYWKFNAEAGLYKLYIVYTIEEDVYEYRVTDVYNACSDIVSFGVMTKNGPDSVNFEYNMFGDGDFVYVTGPDFGGNFFACK